jgi:5'-nucleotidase
MMDLLLLTNDDGYTSPGLRALWEALDDDYETVVIAPKRQRSWIGKAISNPGPLTVESETIDGKAVYIVNDGLPADCANIGLYHLCQRRPTMVISGINIGPNFTSSLALSSGTVGAALEAAQNGVLGIAVSFDLDIELYRQIEAQHQQAQIAYFREAANIVRTLVRTLTERPYPPDVGLINLVIPQQVAHPLRIVPCEPLPYEYGSVFLRRDGQFYNRSVGFLEDQATIIPNSDVWVVRQGWIALTAYTGKLETTTMDVTL